MLSKIVQESVEKFDEQFKSSYAYPFVFNEDVKQFLISSQVSLLEAELERNKSGLTLLAIAPTGVCGFTSQEEIKAYTLAVKDNITYLTEQIEEIKKIV